MSDLRDSIDDDADELGEETADDLPATADEMCERLPDRVAKALPGDFDPGEDSLDAVFEEVSGGREN